MCQNEYIWRIKTYFSYISTQLLFSSIRLSFTSRYELYSASKAISLELCFHSYPFYRRKKKCCAIHNLLCKFHKSVKMKYV